MRRKRSCTEDTYGCTIYQRIRDDEYFSGRTMIEVPEADCLHNTFSLHVEAKVQGLKREVFLDQGVFLSNTMAKATVYMSAIGSISRVSILI